MRPTGLWLLALGAAAVDAFRDTSPFFFASTSETTTLPSSQVKTAPSLLAELSTTLQECPSEYYILALQPGAHSSDYATRESAPRLGAKVLGTDRDIRSSSSVNDVVGLLSLKQIQRTLETSCGTKSTVVGAAEAKHASSSTFDPASRVISVVLDPLPLGSERRQQLLENDQILADFINRLPSPNYTLLYLTTPRDYGTDSDRKITDSSDPDSDSDSIIYESDTTEMMYQEPLVHMGMKRDYSAHTPSEDIYQRVKKNSSSSSTSDTSLFKKYQYFTPGIFMCLIVTFILITILYVAFSALTSLEVSYAAFEKDTSSSSAAAGAGKKQQ